MRILHISSARSFGGGERHLADLANALVRRGHEVYAALRPRSPVREELTALPAENIFGLRLRNALDIRSARELARFVRAHRIEVVHAHVARDYPLAAMAAWRNRRAKLVVTPASSGRADSSDGAKKLPLVGKMASLRAGGGRR